MNASLASDAAGDHRVSRTVITATNGEPIAVDRWDPSVTTRGAVLIVPAMATRARFYGPLAQWLTSQGFTAITFDYQGYGASARTPLRDVRADILTWAADAATVLDWARSQTSGVPLTWVGHSLGGQLLPFVGHQQLDAAVIVGSGTGYWRHSEGLNRVLAPALWYAIAPAATAAFGYYPGRRLRLLGDLPAPVMHQWMSWCKHPDYLLGLHPEHRQAFADVRLPLTSISFTDDKTMSTAATAQLESFYTGADLTRIRLRPEELGAKEIGHFGLFRRGNDTLWERALLDQIRASA